MGTARLIDRMAGRSDTKNTLLRFSFLMKDVLKPVITSASFTKATRKPGPAESSKDQVSLPTEDL